jgi:MFS family permease
MASAYVTEFRQHWRALLASFIGLASGMGATMSAPSIFAPYLLREFGWSRAEFAAVGTLSIFLLFAYPVVGWLADRIGARRTALIGVTALPLAFVAFSFQNGDLRWYAIILVTQMLLGATTTSAVYTRAVVQNIDKARGLGLAIVASGPAFTTAICGPLLNDFVADQGWRAGYLAVAAFTALFGGLALALMPPERDSAAQPRPKPTRADYAQLFGVRAFWIIIGGMFLATLPLSLAHTQMNLLLEDNGVAAEAASPMISAFAIGTLAGRFVCGLALDRFPSQIVAFAALALTSGGLLLIASSFDAAPALILAVFLFGLSIGAEADLVGYIVARTFDLRIYSSIMGFTSLAIAVASSLGGLLLSYMFTFGDSFVLFLLITSATTLLGATMFLFLRRPAVQSN